MSWQEQKFLDYYDIPTTIIPEKEIGVQIPLNTPAGTIIANSGIALPEKFCELGTIQLSIKFKLLSSIASAEMTYSPSVKLMSGKDTSLANVPLKLNPSTPINTPLEVTSMNYTVNPDLGGFWSSTLQLSYDNPSTPVTSKSKILIESIQLHLVDGYGSKYSVRQMASSVRKIQKIVGVSGVTRALISAVNPAKTVVIPPVKDAVEPKWISRVESGVIYEIIELY